VDVIIHPRLRRDFQPPPVAGFSTTAVGGIFDMKWRGVHPEGEIGGDGDPSGR